MYVDITDKRDTYERKFVLKNLPDKRVSRAVTPIEENREKKKKWYRSFLKLAGERESTSSSNFLAAERSGNALKVARARACVHDGFFFRSRHPERVRNSR